MADQQAYSKAVKGKLSFKGVKGTVKRAPKRKIDDDDTPAPQKPTPQNGLDDESSYSGNSEDAAVEEIKILTGTGRMTSSGTTILGHGTLFMNELTHGDAIIVTHPTTFADETKIIRMVLSNISISVSSAFSTDLISTASFRYIKAPKDPNAPPPSEEGENAKKRMTGKGQQDSEEAAFGEYVSQGKSICILGNQMIITI